MTAIPTRFAGRTAIVTGAARGIGEAIARRLADEGADVLIVDASGPAAEAAAASIRRRGGRCSSIEADLADREQLHRAAAYAVAQFGAIDVLVNNAGIGHREPFLDHAEEAWDRVLAVNLTAPFLLAREVGAHMARQARGAVVHIASIDSCFADGPWVGYNAAKAGLLGLMRTMALELGPHGIRSNAVLPGFTATDMVRRDMPPEEWRVMVGEFSRAPLGRMVEPAEIAAAVSFLASDDASAITGASLVVDCGVTADVYVAQTLDRDG